MVVDRECREGFSNVEGAVTHSEFVKNIAEEINGEYLLHLDCAFVNQSTHRNEEGELETDLHYVWPSINSSLYSKRLKNPR